MHSTTNSPWKPTAATRRSGSRASAGLPGRLQITSESNDYGQVPVGSSATATFTVANTGGTTVTVTKSKPPSGGAFAAITSLPEGTTIAPGESLTEKVAFAPSAVGSEEGIWVINGSGSDVEHKIGFNGAGTAAPMVVTGGASSVAQTSATLNADVSPNGEAVSDCHFEYGTSTSYGSSVPCSPSPGSGDGSVAVSAYIEGLGVASAYYFRVVATNSLGTSYGAGETLTTAPATPALETHTQIAAPSGLGLGLSTVIPALESLAPPAPNVVIESLALTARAPGVIAIGVGCPADVSDCAGIIAVRTLTAVATSTQARLKIHTAIVTLARAAFAVAGGRARTLRLHISSSGRALLARVHVLRATATIVAYDRAGATHTTRAIVSIRDASASRRASG